MAGGCRPAATATARVVTASRPSRDSRSMVASMTRCRVCSRPPAAVSGPVTPPVAVPLPASSAVPWPGWVPVVAAGRGDMEQRYSSVDTIGSITVIVIVIPLETTVGVLMIIVTGATGRLGRQIVDRLLARVPAAGVGVSVRDPRRAEEWAGQGVRVRRGDFADAASLAHAFEGATQVLVVSVDAMGEEAVARHRAAIDAAVAAGARRLLYTSHMGASATSLFQPCRDHAATE